VSKVGERLSVLVFALLALGLIVGSAFALGYIVGRLLV